MPQCTSMTALSGTPTIHTLSAAATGKVTRSTMVRVDHGPRGDMMQGHRLHRNTEKGQRQCYAKEFGRHLEGHVPGHYVQYGPNVQQSGGGIARQQIHNRFRERGGRGELVGCARWGVSLENAPADE